MAHRQTSGIHWVLMVLKPDAIENPAYPLVFPSLSFALLHVLAMTVFGKRCRP